MKPYTFSDKAVQEKWADYYPKTWKALKEMKMKMPELNSRTRDLERIIEWIMQENENLAEVLAQIQQFMDLAHAESMMRFREAAPKESTTIIGAQSDGEISQVTFLLGYATNLWKTLDRNGINAASLLKRQP